MLALLTGAACAQDVPVAPKKPVAAKQEDRKAQESSAPRLPPDPSKFAVIISGIGGDEAYSTRFAKLAVDLRSALRSEERRVGKEGRDRGARQRGRQRRDQCEQQAARE